VFEKRLDGMDTATTIDIVLAQIERDLGLEAARKITRMLNPPVMDHVRAEAGDLGLTTKQKVCESARWIRNNYRGPISVARAAEHAAMSKRNYQRRFKVEFGITPLDYLLHTRFEAVCSMLEDTDLPIDKIARSCGMGDGNRLGRIFKERIGMSPTQYRAQKHIVNEASAIAPVGRHDALKPVDEVAAIAKDRG
jgi:transcriptional regulator GlxA family with amidase domain